MNPLNLRYIVKTTILKYLVCSSDISRDHLVMLEYFRGWGQGVFGDEILTQIIEDFPSQLTDELLVILSPPHLRHLKLTNCTRLSCNGLQKAVAKCQQLQALDFSECVHLLHPTVFCCIREKASNLVSLSLENSEVVSDDIVQVALMCCPFLKHLNLSSCKSITDAAFALSDSKDNNTSSTGTASTSHTLHPGHSLTSVDISGCQSLSTAAVKYIVGLCGANLTSINLAWTGISCTALLYLAGLNMEKVARMMCSTDPVQTDSVPSSSEAKQKVACANLNESWRALYGDQDLSTQGFLGSKAIGESVEVTYDFSDSQLNELEVSTLMNVLPMTCEPSLLQSTEGILHVQESNEPSEVPCHEELVCNVELIRTCSSFLPEKVTSSTMHEKESTSSDEQLLETEDKETCMHSDEDIMKKATDMKRTFQCWDVASEVEALKDSKMKNGSFNSVLLPSVQEQSLLTGLEAVPMEKEHHIERNPTTLTTTKKSVGELETEEILEDEFDTESHPVEDHFNCGHSVRMSSLRMGCDIPSMATEVLTLPSIPLVNGMEPDTPTIHCEKVKEKESVVIKSEESDCPIVTPAVKPEHSVCPIIPSVELHEMDEETECKEPPVHCKVEVEKSVLPMVPCKKETGYNNDSLSTIPYIMSENAESSTSSITAHKDEKGREFDHPIATCWEGEAVFPECETDQGEQSCCAIILPNVGATAEKCLQDCKLSHSKILQVTDLLQAQLFQPKITSLDITNMWYQSKPLGQACLKIFSDANKCLKNFAVSWSHLDDRMLTYLLKNQPELECLSLVDCEKLSNISLSSIPIHCPNLSSFDLKGMCYVTDHGLIPLTRSSHLQSLSLAEAPITDCTLDSIAKGCGAKLKVLDISWCEDVTDQGMAIMAKNCRSLQYLGVRQCAASKLTLNTLADNCHLVSSLNIAGIDKLTDAALGSLAENMPLLREIDASWNSSLSDTGISALLRCCNKLKKVVLCGLKLITSQPFLGIIGDLKRWQLLEELWQHGKRRQTSSSQGKVGLKSCDSETAKSLGDEIPSRSMSYAPSLRHMVLEYSDKVNDDHLAAIVAVCRGTLYVKDYYGQQIEPKWIFR